MMKLKHSIFISKSFVDLFYRVSSASPIAHAVLSPADSILAIRKASNISWITAKLLKET